MKKIKNVIILSIFLVINSTLYATVDELAVFDFTDGNWTANTTIWDPDTPTIHPTSGATGITSATQLFVEESNTAGNNADGVTLEVNLTTPIAVTIGQWYWDVRLEFDAINPNTYSATQTLENPTLTLYNDSDGFIVSSTDGTSFNTTTDSSYEAFLDTNQNFSRSNLLANGFDVFSLSFGEMFTGTFNLTNLYIAMQVNGDKEDYELANFRIVGVPEPSSSILIILSMAGLVFMRRRKK